MVEVSFYSSLGKNGTISESTGIRGSTNSPSKFGYMIVGVEVSGCPSSLKALIKSLSKTNILFFVVIWPMA